MAAVQKSRGISNAQAEGCSALWSHPVFSSFTVMHFHDENDENEIVRNTNDDATVSRLQVFPSICHYSIEDDGLNDSRVAMSHTQISDCQGILC